MATLDTVGLGDLLKRLYASWDIEQLVNLSYPALAQCAPEGNAALGGNGFRFAVRGQSAHGHAYIGENDSLPVRYATTVYQATVSPTVHAGVVEVTGLAAAVSSGDAMSFARAFDENVQATIESMSAYKEGALFRDGTGQLGSIITDPGTGTAWADLSFSDVGYLREGMRIDVFNSTGATLRTGSPYTIVDVDWVNKTIDTSAAADAGIVVGDIVYIDSSKTAGFSLTATNEPVGFAASLGTAAAYPTYLGLTRSATSNWTAGQIAAAGFFDEELLLRARTRLTQEAGIPLTSMASRLKLLTHPTQVDSLFKLAIPRIRFDAGGKFDLGNSDNVEFGGIKFVTSYQCPTGTAYLGDFRKSMSLYTNGGKLHVDTEYNGSSLKWVSEKDAGLVFLKEYCGFAVKNPPCFVAITGLSQLSR